MESLNSVLNRMEREDLTQRDNNVSREKRWRSVPRVTGEFLYQLVMLHQPKQVVEIGMSHGFSTVWMGLACQNFGGRIDTYEVIDWRYEKAVNNFNEANLTEIINPHLVSPDFTEYPDNIDFVFIDAEKSDYIGHIKNLEPKLSSDAVIVADNTVSHQGELKSYLDYVRSSDAYFSTSVPIGKGLELTRKISESEIIRHLI